MKHIMAADTPVVAFTCPPRPELSGLGMPGARVPSIGVARLTGRPIQAPAVAATAQAQAYAFAATNGAESRTKQHHEAWALRGLEPWSYPA